ncbi:short-chain dehydrogenase/reductase [Chloropicon primus]|nr:short-chain dehydrogenase/reductase [Chloropicon primus]
MNCLIAKVSGRRVRSSLGSIQVRCSNHHAAAQGEVRKVALVQGASRGLGLEFVSQLLGRQGDSRVIATCRSPETAQSLLELQDKYGRDRLYTAPIDLTKPATIEEAAKLVRENFSAKVDLLLNVSGVLHIPGKMMPETSLDRVNYDQLLLSFQTNAIGPALVCRAFWPLLQESAKADGRVLPTMVNISARVGSIEDNGLGGWYSYRSSKSALNQLTKTMSLEFARKNPRVAAVALHPGTNDTDLSKPFQRNVPEGKLFTKEFGVRRMLEVIDSLREQDNGSFFAWDGQKIPW